MKRILALALASALVLSSVPAFAANRGETGRKAETSVKSGHPTRETNRNQHENSFRSEYRTEERTMARRSATWKPA